VDSRHWKINIYKGIQESSIVTITTIAAMSAAPCDARHQGTSSNSKIATDSL
jgi:hypothetical protein